MRRWLPLLLTALVVPAAVGMPAAPVTLTHEAYVWQRAWTGAVDDAVAAAPAELDGLRVLALELPAGAAAPVWPALDTTALVATHRPVTIVARIDGARLPAGLSLAPLLARVAAWRAAGVDVVGVEIDHDCATAALADYAGWLAAARPPAPLRWSITALPTWAGAPALGRVAAAVDELVVQVHAVRAPRLFDARTARRDLQTFAAAVPGARLRVALPTYRVTLGGQVLAADPAAVAGLVRSLEQAPIAGVAGVVWFRLPVGDDATAWPTPTLRAVIAGQPLAADVRVELVATGGDRYDVVLANRGTLPAPWPALALRGAFAADLLDYAARDPHHFAPPRRSLAAGGRTVVGWATGEDLHVDAL